MKTMKKPITIFLLFLLAAAFLSACGDSSDTDSGKKRKGDSLPTVTAAPNGTNPTGTPEERFPNRPNADTLSGKVKELEPGDVAPDFSLTLLDGSTFRMSDHDDEIVLLNFWATWCGPCIREMPDLQRLAGTYSEGVTVRCLSIGGEGENAIRQFAESEGYAKFFIGCADGTVIADYYPSDYIPYTVLVRNGIVEETMVGTHSFDDYRKMIDRYLEK